MKYLKGFLLVVVVTLVALIPLRNMLLKRQLEKLLAEQTGFGAELGQVHLGLTSASFAMEGFTLKNPPDFPEASALEVKQVRVDYDWRSLFSREVRFSEITLDVPKMVVVRKADGETNAERLGGKARQKKEETESDGKAPEPAPEPPTAPEEEKEPRTFRVDRLVLRIGTVEYRDYTKAEKNGEPSITAMTLNVDQEYRDVTSLQQLGSQVLGQTIQRMGLLLVGQELENPESKLNKKIKKAADKFQKQLNGLFGAPAEKQP